MKKIKFEYSHLKNYSIVSKPCVAEVRCRRTVKEEYLYTGDGAHRWFVDLYVITDKNLISVEKILQEKRLNYYNSISPYLMTGVIWEDAIYDFIDLPIKKEKVIAVFDYVDEILRCVQINMIPKIKLDMYIPSEAMLKETEDMIELIKTINHEK